MKPSSFFHCATVSVRINWSGQVMFAAMHSLVEGLRAESMSFSRESLR